MAYTVLDRVYSIFIDVMTGVSSGNGNATFYNTDSHTSYIEVTVTNGVQSFNMDDILLWESIPTVEANAITEFIFKKKASAWLCKGITYRQQS